MNSTNYKFNTISCKDDYEGRVIATLIETTEKKSDHAILYIHGFSDYFFHDHVAQKFNSYGIDLYALELRKYGRSKLTNQHHFYCRNIEEYFEEITQAIDFLDKKEYKKISLLGHSMGGLTVSMYLYKGELKHKVNSAVLNSPFFDFPISETLKKVLPLSGFISKIFPFAIDILAEKEGLNLYNDSLHKNYKGEWDFFRTVKQPNNDVYYAWANAIFQAQKMLHNGLNLSQPILVLYSDKSLQPKKWTDEIKSADIVLNVEDIKKHAPKLGSNVNQIEIKYGVHDLFLSKHEVREEALNKSINWLKTVAND